MAFYFYVVGILRAPKDVQHALSNEGRDSGRFFTDGRRTYYFVGQSHQRAGLLAKQLAKEFAPGRVWIEGIDSASSRPIEADLHQAFAVRPDEQDRAAPFHGGESDWFEFAYRTHLDMVSAYANGEIPLERALTAVEYCSSRCRQAERVMLYALTMRRMLEHPPPERTGKYEPNPRCLRFSAAALVHMLREDHPDADRSLGDWNKWTAPIFKKAAQDLERLGLCHVTPRTLYDWCLEARKARVLPPLKRGRRRRNKNRASG